MLVRSTRNLLDPGSMRTACAKCATPSEYLGVATTQLCVVAQEGKVRGKVEENA